MSGVSEKNREVRHEDLQGFYCPEGGKDPEGMKEGGQA
jgi:hypothetical protein